ncbi:hypothetical protein EON81_05150 [bacterium]|nr:MAG: hypothetical protein EON81_05150 [bacterium]
MMYYSRSVFSVLALSLAGFSAAQFSFRTFDNSVLGRPVEAYQVNGYATGISADGTKLSGQRVVLWPFGHPRYGYAYDAALFSVSGGVLGMTLLGDLSTPPSGNLKSKAIAISGDGTRPIGEGYGNIEGYDRFWPVLFNPLALVHKFPGVANVPTIKGINYNGSAYIGYGTGSYTTDPYGSNVVRWHRWKNGAIEAFEPFGSGGIPTGISWDGKTFVGYTGSPHPDSGTMSTGGFRYRDGKGFELLPRSSGLAFQYVAGVSGDGKVTYGYGQTFDQTSSNPRPWYHSDKESSITVMDVLPDYPKGEFLSASQDGSVLVGRALDGGNSGTAFLWTRHSGAVRLQTYLEAHGVDLGGHTLYNATGVSADGRTICGDARGIDPVNGEVRTLPYVVHIDLPNGVINLTASSKTAVGGGTRTGTITLFKAAGQDETVTLATDRSDLVTLPATVTVPAGSTAVTFPIGTNGTAVRADAKITATLGNGRKETDITLVQTTVKNLSVTYNGYPSPLDGGKPATATVLLTGKAPVGGAAVQVWDNTTLFGLPASSEPMTVTVPEGETFVRFPVTTLPYREIFTRNVFCLYGTSGRTASLTIKPWYTPSALTVTPTTFVGGTGATATVKLNQAAGTGGAVVTIALGSNVVSAPSSVTVPAGATSATFAISSVPVSATVGTYIQVSSGGVSRKINLKITKG